LKISISDSWRLAGGCAASWIVRHPRFGAVQRAGMTVAAAVDPESPGVDAGRLGRGVKPIRVGRRSIGTSSRASVCAS